MFDWSVRIRRSTSLLVLAAVLASAVPAKAQEAVRISSFDDNLEKEFSVPPADARPRVWWHWLDGNVTPDGIKRDLDWMHEIGIGGLQNFDAALPTQQIVDKRLVYMSPEWRSAFRLAVSKAAELGIQYGIAASPGWSETGGPWVPPEDGMKKLVWTETSVEGGRPFKGILAQPPSVAGPFQNIARHQEHGFTPPEYYHDSYVIAFREAPPVNMDAARTMLVNGEPTDAKALTDGDWTTGIAIPTGSAASPGSVEFDYSAPQTVRSLRLFISDLPAQSIAGPLAPKLEASDDGQSWKKVADIGLTSVPRTISFAPVTARRFRVLFTRGVRPDMSSFRPAPGADLRAAAGVGGSRPTEPRIAELALSSEAKINAFEQKAGFALSDDYYALEGAAEKDPDGIDPHSVIDLTSRMRADGHLEWNPPRGHWRVLRMGYSLTGKSNAPATVEATGLEVDKYDAAAVTRYIEKYLALYEDAAGKNLLGTRGITSIVMDSTEVGPSNWTPQLRSDFQRLRGYDPLPWFPALTGKVVGSRSRADAFLYDFRKTLADLAVSEHYATVARIAKERGLTVYGESLEGGRTISTLGDDLDMRSHADVPMGAMWAYADKPAPNLVADMRGAASVAHFYGRALAAAESLTSILSPWAFAPRDLQPMIDAEFVNGINQPFLHSVVHQPLEDRAPGLTLGTFGQYFNRHETWAHMARSWMDYIARTSFMLRQGRNVADIAYLYGEEAPVGVQALHGAMQRMPRRYGYDFVSAAAVQEGLSATGSELLSVGGARYKALFLGGSSRHMTLPLLRKIAALVENGATIIGRAPRSSPSLGDDPKAFADLVESLWSSPPPGTRSGRVIDSDNLEGSLETLGIAPDFTYTGKPDSDVQFTHRSLADGEIYFVSNRKDRAENIEAAFRVSGKAAEIWRAADGKTSTPAYRTQGNQTFVSLSLNPGESVFVVFRRSGDAQSAGVPEPVYRPRITLDKGWKVTFQDGRGAPPGTHPVGLGSLSDQQDPAIRYFSGTASYSAQFALSGSLARSTSLILDLGQVADVAEVMVNGHTAGIAWKPPYQLDIGRLVRSGTNTLEVRVANLWVNRLIGDQQPDATKVAFVTTPTYIAKAKLRPSGLIGPVRILTPATSSDLP